MASDCKLCDGGWLRDGFAGPPIRCECNPKPEPWIVAAANRYDNGFIAVGARHFDELMRAQVAAAGLRGMSHEQGFIDNNRDFHTREQAWVIAERNGQIKRVTGSRGTLYSEDIYP